MPKRKLVQVRDMKIALKDMEPYVKNPRFLRVGREFTNFSLRPREFWANWLICAVKNGYEGFNLTVSEDPTGGDGVLYDKNLKRYILTEHVFIPEPRTGENRSVEDLMIEALELKVAKGSAYALGKNLVIFSEGIGEFFPNRVARRITGKHAFDSVVAVGLTHSDETGYFYWVTFFDISSASVFRVSINYDFSSWEISKSQ